jgi:uracil DNA glycosylase
MEWKQFESKFHKTWHTSMKKWVEGKDSAKVYAFLKNQRGKEIAPKSNLTFRTFEQPLDKVKVVVLLEEPFCGKQDDVQFADGIPLSCEYVNKMHSHLREFYEAMEREFYDLSLHTIMNKDLKFLTNQGVLFLSSSLTVEIGSPGKHKDLWVSLIGHLIKTVFCKKDIPIIFCGSNVYEQYKFYVDPIFPYFVVKQPLSEWKLGTQWKTDGKFSALNKYLWEETKKDDIMWVNQDVPY